MAAHLSAPIHDMANPMSKESHVRWFENIRLKDIPEVGGKTASLGELFALLAEDGGRVADTR